VVVPLQYSVRCGVCCVLCCAVLICDCTLAGRIPKSGWSLILILILCICLYVFLDVTYVLILCKFEHFIFLEDAAVVLFIVILFLSVQ